jgi:catechol 2,3-dioxygenase-like lactoylglutathione lyase family enzyme
LGANVSLIITHFTILVEDVDEALKFYTDKLGFIKHVDKLLWVNMRWVTVSPKNQPNLQLSLVKAEKNKELLTTGRQAPNNPLMFLETDDIKRDFNQLKSRGVHFMSQPEDREWGTEVVFEDLYGNVMILVERPKIQT